MTDVADLFVKGADGGFVSADERADLEKSGQTFEIVGATFEAAGKYGDSFVLDIILDGEERKLRAPFNTGMESRDATVKNISEYFANGGSDTVTARVSSAGRGWVIDPA